MESAVATFTVLCTLSFLVYLGTMAFNRVGGAPAMAIFFGNHSNFYSHFNFLSSDPPDGLPEFEQLDRSCSSRLEDGNFGFRRSDSYDKLHQV